MEGIAKYQSIFSAKMFGGIMKKLLLHLLLSLPKYTDI